MVVARALGRVRNGSGCLVGTELQWGKMRRFRRWMGGDSSIRPVLNATKLYTYMVKVVKFMFVYFTTVKKVKTNH